jgi:hypothetical protein
MLKWLIWRFIAWHCENIMQQSTIGWPVILHPYGGQFIINLWQNYQTMIDCASRSLSTTIGLHYIVNKNTISVELDLVIAKYVIYIARTKITSSDAYRCHDRKFTTPEGRKYLNIYHNNTHQI